jgi:hypothetical protein
MFKHLTCIPHLNPTYNHAHNTLNAKYGKHMICFMAIIVNFKSILSMDNPNVIPT